MKWPARDWAVALLGVAAEFAAARVNARLEAFDFPHITLGTAPAQILPA